MSSIAETGGPQRDALHTPTHIAAGGGAESGGPLLTACTAVDVTRRPGAATRTGQALYARARQLIPGGTQLLSKRPEMFLPGEWPAYYSKASGAETWDLDGNRYVDVTHFGVGACVLGFADPDVDAAVIHAVGSGSMSTLNCPEE